MKRTWLMALLASAGFGLYLSPLSAGEPVVVDPKSPLFLDEPLCPGDLDLSDTVFWKGILASREVQSYYLSATVPLASSDRSLLLFETQGAWNDPLDEQINAGLIHRWTPGGNVIIGSNFFYDYNSSIRGNGYGGVGTGMEVLTPNFEMRFNYYWPDSRQPSIGKASGSTRNRSTREDLGTTRTVAASGSPTSTSTASSTSQSVNLGGGVLTTTTTTTTTTTRQNFLETLTTRTRNSQSSTTRTVTPGLEAAMQGFDAEAGVSPEFLPDWMNVWGFIGYYDFQNPFGPDSAGFKARAEWRFNEYLCLESTYYENAFSNIGGNWYGGVRMSCPLDGDGGFRNKLANLFVPQGDPTCSSRWLERVNRQRRFMFAESEPRITETSTSSSSIQTTRRFNPFIRSNTATSTSTSTVFTPVIP